MATVLKPRRASIEPKPRPRAMTKADVANVVPLTPDDVRDLLAVLNDAAEAAEFHAQEWEGYRFNVGPNAPADVAPFKSATAAKAKFRPAKGGAK